MLPMQLLLLPLLLPAAVDASRMPSEVENSTSATTGDKCHELVAGCNCDRLRVAAVVAVVAASEFAEIPKCLLSIYYI